MNGSRRQDTYIPRYVYRRMTMLCKSYYEIRKRLATIDDEIINASAGAPDGQPRGTMTGDPTAAKAERLIRAKDVLQTQIDAMDQAMSELRPEEQSIIKANLYDKIPMQQVYTQYSIRKIKYIRRRYIMRAAEILGEI